MDSDRNFIIPLKTSAGTLPNPGPVLPPSQCVNGSPVDKYSGYGVNSWEVLYSIWNSYQVTSTPVYLNQVYLTEAGQTPPSSPVGPSNIFIFRHGEKNPVATNGGYHDNQNGIYRSCQIIEFINGLANQGYPISYIVTCNPCDFSTLDASTRPQQTIMPAAFCLNIPMYIYGEAFDGNAITAEKLFTSDFYNGKNVVICWEHSNMQKLLKSIVQKGINVGRINYTSPYDYFKNQNPNPCPDGNYEINTSDPDYEYGDEFIPYWNTDCFDKVFWFQNDNMNFFTFLEPCLTCYSSCNLQICGHQVSSDCVSSTKYAGETSCQLPSAPVVNPNTVQKMFYFRYNMSPDNKYSY